MIASIKLFTDKTIQNLDFVQAHNYKISIVHQVVDTLPTTFEITFIEPIIQFRNFDYKWHQADQRHLANWHSPKIIMLESGQMVQANQYLGIWEINGKDPRVLLWHFNIKNSHPMAEYGYHNSKHITNASAIGTFTKTLELLFPLQDAIEVSRSKIPFSAIACFTDHCDFDTLWSLKQQRDFFNRHQIKVTKGFFLNHYSKRPDTACYELHHEEIEAWKADGHELAYHSLSQSIKPIADSLYDFENFEPPMEDIHTWIDHGFQPYNVSLQKNYEAITNDYGILLKKKKLQTLWNYIDSGTAAKGVINQINPKQFTLKSYYKGIKKMKFRYKVSLFIKTIVFHFYNTEASLQVYRNLATYYKTRGHKKSFGKHIQMIKNVFNLSALLLPILLFWKTKKNRIYPMAEYTPVSFNHTINNETFTIFQTLEMIDFKTALHPHNIDLLIKERGLFIAHTYFSAPMNYHTGKLFGDENSVNQRVEENFSYLASKIISHDIWNPTLHELVLYLDKFKSLKFNIDDKGKLHIEQPIDQLAFRNVR